MMLIDTDVLIDIALDRRPHSEPASELLDRIERGLETAYIAWHTVSNFYRHSEPALGTSTESSAAWRPHTSRGIPYPTSITSWPRRVEA